MAMYPAPTGASRRYEGMLKLRLVAFLAWSLSAFATADDCTQVRFSDIGWADVTATTALAVEVLHDLGYEGHVELLSLPVTFVTVFTAVEELKPDLLVLLGDLDH